jgi:hypothetical protein
MKEYDVVRREKLPDMIADVNLKLSDGWDVAGGVCVHIPTMGPAFFAQSVVRNKPIEFPVESAAGVDVGSDFTGEASVLDASLIAKVNTPKPPAPARHKKKA